MKTLELNEQTGKIETHQILGECAHCDEPTERLNSATPKCPHCEGLLCPCCAPSDCPENTKPTVPQPARLYDYVSQIIAYESGELTSEEIDELFDFLRVSGIGRQLQGHYSSRM